ncbi:hypothetical protein WJX81_006307 [Elliptochloris bilobata]|uniref:ATP-binding cassette transporter n=1 Tax=Elliptochloris bilobata TaxID=381761 RepID=A0AAW1RSF4_9CHLO
MDDQRAWGPRKREAYDRSAYGPPPPFKRGRFEPQPPLPGPPQPFGPSPAFRGHRGSPPHRSPPHRVDLKPATAATPSPPPLLLLSPPPPLPSSAAPSKDTILGGIEKADADIAEAEAALAALEAEAAAAAAAAAEARAGAARLAEPLPLNHAPESGASGSLKKAWAAAALAESSGHTAGSAGTDARRLGSGRSASASASAAAAAAVAAEAAEAAVVDADMEGDPGDRDARSSGRSSAGGEDSWAEGDGDVDSLRARLLLPRRCQVEAVVALNIERGAEARRALLLRLLPPKLRSGDAEGGAHSAAPKALYNTPQEAPPYARNLAEHASVGGAIAGALRARRRAVALRERQLAAQYRRLYEAWRLHIMGVRKAEPSHAAGSYGSFTGRLGSRKASGMVRSSYEEEQVVLQLQAVERMKDMCKIPSQLLCPHERASQRFDSANALVADPVAAREAEERERPWAPDEKRVFNEKFLAFGKDFRRIATFLDHRSTADCITHFYRTQKLDEFAAVRRKQQLKKRRTQTEVNRSITYLGVAAPPGAARRGDLPYGRATGEGGPLCGGGAPEGGAEDANPNSVAWTADEEALFVNGVRQFGRDPAAIRRLMGATRTLGAIKSFYSKNRSRLGLDSLLEALGWEAAPQALAPADGGSKRPSFWNEVEKQAFLDAYQAHGRKWAQLEAAVPTKTSMQIKNYYQNYKGKLGLDKADQPRSAHTAPPRSREAEPLGRSVSAGISASGSADAGGVGGHSLGHQARTRSLPEGKAGLGGQNTVMNVPPWGSPDVEGLTSEVGASLDAENYPAERHETPSSSRRRSHTFSGVLSQALGAEQRKDASGKGGLERALDEDDLESLEARQRVVQTAVGPSGDPEDLLKRIRARFDRVGLELPTVEVRFEGVQVETEVFRETSRNLPSLYNTLRNSVEWSFLRLGLLRSYKKRLVILNNISSLLTPGRFTLLLGPPASGKSTLLKLLAGKLQHSSGLYVKGRVMYNGRELSEFIPERSAVYVTQEDQHMPELTVRETLDFSARCQGTGSHADEVEELQRREREVGVEVDDSAAAYMRATAVSGRRHSVATEAMIDVLGLNICADTIIGNAMRRGVSGGQKKRVTSGEMLVGPKHVLFMDEISTGLDSSTTYQIVKYLRDATHELRYTTMVALLQPAPETYELFDDVLLLSDGYLVFHGPRAMVPDFFEALGFRCPERKGEADFLQEVTSRRDQALYWSNPEQPWRYVSVPEFAEHFRNFSAGREIAKRLATAPSPAPLPAKHTASGHEEVLARSKFALSPWQLFSACMERDLVLLSRNLFLYGFRFGCTMFMAFVTATLFLRTNLHPTSIEDGQLYFAVLFFSLIMLMFDGFAEETVTVQRLPGWFKQRSNRLYPAWAYVFPVSLLRIPYSLTVAVCWSIIVYYPVGLTPDPATFFTFVLLLFLLHSMGISLFRLSGSICRDETIASTGGAFLFLVMLLLGGFLLSVDKIPPWWIWFFWIDPFSYAQKAIAVNEFGAARWQSVITPQGSPLGLTILDQKGLPHEHWWIWLGVGVIILFTILFNIGTWLCHAYLNPLGKPAVTMREEQGEGDEAAQRQATAGVSAKSVDVRAANDLHVSANSRAQGRSRRAVQLTQADTANEGECDASSRQQPVDLSPAVNPNHNPISRRRSMGSLAQLVASSRRAESGVLADGAVAPRGMSLPFTPLCLTFRELSYYVALPKELENTPRAVTVEGRQMLQLLRACSGAFQPGVLTALVGSSGAGKTTLMDVIAGRKTTGTITGDIRVGGFPKVQHTFARVMGYVEQSDIHSPMLTVLESLVFSARLRHPASTPLRTVYAFVGEIMALVELGPLAQALVGRPGSSGLSVEQRKRLTIGVELVANPSIVFMDEPTSGLDARAAAIVMRSVRNIVSTGRTIVCTIHQPSIDIFEAFDDLLLMKSGGYITYHGPLGEHSRKLVEYFEAVPGVPPLAEGLNPATWMLQVSTSAMEASIGVDFAEVYRNSPLHQRNEALIDRLSEPPKGAKPLEFRTHFPQPATRQFAMVFWKFWQSYLRNVPYNGTRFVFATVLALLFGSILWGVGQQRGTLQAVGNVMGSLYLSVLFLGIINSRTVQPVASEERAVSYRERAAGMYSSLPFALAQCMVEIPYNFVQAILFSAISYFMLQFDLTPGKFFWYLLIIYLTLDLMSFYGIMGVYITPDLRFASILSGFFYGLWNLFAGFLIGRAQMVPWWSWYYYINPVAWSLYGIIVTQLGDREEEVAIPGGGTTTIKAYLRDTFGYELELIGPVIAILVAFSVFFMFMAVVVLRTINFQKR